MSSYLSFYIKKDTKNNTPVYTYLFGVSSSHYLYQAFCAELGGHTTEKGHCMKLSRQDLYDVCHSINDTISTFKDIVKTKQELLQQIGTWNNSADEKSNMWLDIGNEIRSCQEELDECASAKHLLTTLMFIQTEYWQSPDDVLYGGIDCCAPDEDDEEC